jgi:hypothetical protein
MVDYVSSRCMKRKLSTVFLCSNESYVVNEQAKNATKAVR